MRFVFAIISFVLAAVLMALGIGERTFLAGPDEVTSSTAESTDSPVVVVTGGALNAYERTQSLELSGAPEIVAAYGRTGDVLAWVGDAEYTEITFDEKTGQLASKVISGTESKVPSLAGSDLWLREYSGGNTLRMRVDLPPDVSVVAISDGTAPAPTDVSVTWPLDRSSPWAQPLMAAGGGFLLLGLVLLIWALVHMRRSRGPRRTSQKQPKMPKLPRQPRYKPGRPKAITAKGRRATRMVVALPMMVAGTVLLAGCTMDGWPTLSQEPVATPTPSVSSESSADSDLQPPAVTEKQVSRIVDEIGTVVTEADSKLDAGLIASRLTGPALELRLANYKIRTADPALPPVPPIPSGPVELILPQQGDAWPRTVFAVIQDKTNTTVAPVALILVQDDARSNYKVNYAVTLEPNVVLDNLAPASVGAAKLPPDFKLLQMAPDTVAAAYGDILMTDTASPSYAQFDAEKDTLRTKVGLAAKNAAVAALPTTAKQEFANAPGAGQVVALSTSDSGAIVAVQLNETETVTPVKEGATINGQGGVKVLSGKETSAKGLIATYSDQLLFYVPSINEPGKIMLLGFSQGLVEAKEVP